MATVQEIKDHLSPDRPLEEVVKGKWWANHRAEYKSDFEAELAWQAHWQWASDFLQWISEHTEPIFVTTDTDMTQVAEEIARRLRD